MTVFCRLFLNQIQITNLQRISIAVQRGKSACILGTLENNKIEDFYLS